MKKGKKNSKATYTQEFKNSIVKKMLPPESIPAAELSDETGVSKAALLKERIKLSVDVNNEYEYVFYTTNTADEAVKVAISYEKRGTIVKII